MGLDYYPMNMDKTYEFMDECRYKVSVEEIISDLLIIDFVNIIFTKVSILNKCV